MRSYVEADPLPLILAHLRDHPRVRAELGDPEHISGERAAPWPHLEVTPGDGGDIDQIGAGPITVPVSFTLWGHPDGRTGPAQLRRLSIIIIEACKELEHLPHLPGQPVISVVSFGGHPAGRKLTTGQRQWDFSGMFTTTPPTATSAP